MILSWAPDARHGAEGFSVCLLGFGFTVIQSFLAMLHLPCWDVCLSCAIGYWKYVTCVLCVIYCRFRMWIYSVCIICTPLSSNLSHVPLATPNHNLSFYNCKYKYFCMYVHIYHTHMCISIQPTVSNSWWYGLHMFRGSITVNWFTLSAGDLLDSPPSTLAWEWAVKLRWLILSTW